MARKPIPDQTQDSVLLKSRRRCCLCFWLDGNDEVQKGQLAHLDWDNANAAEDNLVFLCLRHHDEYDSTPRLSKGLRQAEVKRWRDELYREMQHRFRTLAAGPLTMIYDEQRHCYREDNEQCAIYRISVRNDGQTTINNVSVKVVELSSKNPAEADERLIGVRLSVASNPRGPYSMPQVLPTSLVLLHPGEEATFDFLRLCLAPGNHFLCHSAFTANPHSPYLDQRPSGVLPPAHYDITLSVQGNDLSPTLQRFAAGATEEELAFEIVTTTTG